MCREMKDSGIEWIGEIPKEWRVVSFKNIISFIVDNRGKTPPIEEAGIPLLEIDSLSNKYPDISKIRKFISQKTYNSFLRKYLESGDILFATVGAIGKISIVPNDFNYCIAQNIVGFRVNDCNDNLFWFYYMKSDAFKMTYLQFNKGNIQDSIKISNLMNGKVIQPQILKQKIIANYLDKKVSQIDDIISKQKSLIEKYKAYKQSLITETVTKGLNKNVPMKDSGIEWIGEIPSHWNIKKMKYLGSLNSSGVDKKIRENEKLYKSVHYVNVYKNGQKEIVNSDDYLVISCDDNKATNCTLLRGDVLFTNSSETAEDMGASTVVAEDLVNTLFGYHLMRFRPYPNVLWYKYEKYLFSSNYMRKWFEYNSVGMTRFGLAQRGFSEAQIIYAPYEEQKEIANYLDKKCNAIDSAIAKKEELIEKLEAYKKSLIYECVTGKREVN